MTEQTKVKIGLEIHCQLTSLKTKLFCGCSADYRGKPPNTHVCPVCLGLPGAMPVINKKAVEMALMVALALNCKIAKTTFFARKNYFYPDLPKNFQISQYDLEGGEPLASNGYITLTVNKTKKTVRIRRIHLEEDPGKLFHPGGIGVSSYTLIDYNRSGIALVEIVTEPDFKSPVEARIFLQKLRSILEHLGVFDGGLEGAMRCDANISVKGGGRVEIKNISSFKDVERALNYEIIRQKDLVKKGVKFGMETRHWDEARRITVTLRAKEEEQDYRYFVEPDLCPILIDEEWVERLKHEMPELPDARKERFMREYGLPEYDSEVLVSERALADFFEECVKIYGKPKPVANWLMGDVLQCLHSLETSIDKCKVTPKHLAEMLMLMDKGDISIKIAKKVLWEMMKTGKTALTIVEEKGWKRITNIETLEKIVSKVFMENPKAVKDALIDEKAIHYLVGKTMEATKGMADPNLTNQIIRKKLVEWKNKEA
ncbi:MAG: Asp-tRNA(Asn)/Glu-tRNA(Gln) amidotransferase GatCAB subunit B [Candidatus Hecatellales archaeon ex4484_218]|nr:MAG: Asp-tRNA(Asn)/Glu-tRNA(Gln) amidotransferase GatCAB subunit B [Candidatus Hecatellales archaeon ex4484_218]